MKRILLLLCLLPITAACQSVPHKAELSWTASPTADVTYNILRGSVAGGVKTKIASGVAVLTYSDSGLAANTQYCYQVTASKAGMNDSAPSNEVCGTTDKDSAGTPGTLVITIK